MTDGCGDGHDVGVDLRRPQRLHRVRTADSTSTDCTNAADGLFYILIFSKQ